VGRVGWASRGKPGLGQHLLGGDVLAGGGGPQRSQSVLQRGQLAQLPDGRGGDTAPSGILGDPVTELGNAVPGEDQVEPAQDGATLIDEHVEGCDAGILLGQQGAVPIGELGKELITPVRNRGGKVGAVCQLEGQDRRGMVSSQALQFGHRPTLPRGRAYAI